LCLFQFLIQRFFVLLSIVFQLCFFNCVFFNCWHNIVFLIVFQLCLFQFLIQHFLFFFQLFFNCVFSIFLNCWHNIFVFFKPNDHIYVGAVCMCGMDTTLDIHGGWQVCNTRLAVEEHPVLTSTFCKLLWRKAPCLCSPLNCN
jgi:hypothetical protein